MSALLRKKPTPKTITLPKPGFIRGWLQSIILPRRNTKWILSFGGLILSTWFFLKGFITQETWKEILIYVIGIYSVGNVAATWAHNGAEPKEEVSHEPVS